MPETIMIMDNTSNHLRMTGYTIGRKLGYHVVMADGEAAVRRILSARKSYPDLLLVDLSAPGASGFHLIRDIKSACPQLLVVALIAYGDDDGAVQAVQAGVHDFLCKPVTIERLRISLRNALEIRRLRDIAIRPDGRGDLLPGNAAVLFDDQGRIRKLKAIEKEIIRLALHYNNGCMTRAARQLGIGRSTLYRRVGERNETAYTARANQAMRPMMMVSSGERS